MGLRLGVDIGGTFTDLAVVDEDTGEQTTYKLSSTPSDYSAAVIDAITTLSTDHGIAPSSLSFLSHATTVVTNAILESKGARAALITTDGFRDILEIRRQSRARSSYPDTCAWKSLNASMRTATCTSRWTSPNWTASLPS